MSMVRQNRLATALKRFGGPWRARPFLRLRLADSDEIQFGKSRHQHAQQQGDMKVCYNWCVILVCPQNMQVQFVGKESGGGRGIPEIDDLHWIICHGLAP